MDVAEGGKSGHPIKKENSIIAAVVSEDNFELSDGTCHCALKTFLVKMLRIHLLFATRLYIVLCFFL